MGRKKNVPSTQSSQAIMDPKENGEGKLKRVGGSMSDKFNNKVAHEAMNALWLPERGDCEKEQETMQAVVDAMGGIAPQDELEGMLATQLCAAHSASMENHRRAFLAGLTIEEKKLFMLAGDRASRTFVALSDSLNKHRGKGQQMVTVEHVHVYEGGKLSLAISNPREWGKCGSKDVTAEKMSESDPDLAWNTKAST